MTIRSRAVDPCLLAAPTVRGRTRRGGLTAILLSRRLSADDAMAIGDNRPLSYIFARKGGLAMMTSDLWALIGTIGLAIGQLTIASILTLRQLGGAWVAGARDEPRAATGISGRFVRAHRNLLEIFPQFVAAVFVVHAAGVAGHWSAIGAWVFFAARCLYVPAYAFGPIGVRPACWVTAQIGIVLIFGDLIR
jgi:uncharacterized MAPEG superfamily protein